MRLLSSVEFRRLDRETISTRGITSLQLMEIAAEACAEQLLKMFQNRAFTFVCGMGNNGGDGLAIARILASAGYKSEVIIVGDLSQASRDFLANRERLKLMSEVTAKSFEESGNEDISADRIIIDAIFGIGLNRPAYGAQAAAIDWINSLPNQVVSIDLPSGMAPDWDAAVDGPCVKSDLTLTFHLPKSSFLFEKSGKNVGRLLVLNIELNNLPDDSPRSLWYWSDHRSLVFMLQRENPFAHKGTNGYIMLVAGSEMMPGAAILACGGALYSGVGLVGLIGQRPVGLQPEVISIGDVQMRMPSAICIGPGLGNNDTAVSKVLTESASIPLLLDADALNIIAKMGWQSLIPANSIITPHAREFQRLFGFFANDTDALCIASKEAINRKIIIVFKGPHTRVILPDGSVHFNGSGNAGMGKAGMGDVLSGLIGGLLAKGYPPKAAAILGVFVHGRAGDLALESLGFEGMTATTLTGFLPAAFAELRNA